MWSCVILKVTESTLFACLKNRTVSTDDWDLVSHIVWYNLHRATYALPTYSSNALCAWIPTTVKHRIHLWLRYKDDMHNVACVSVAWDKLASVIVNLQNRNASQLSTATSGNAYINVREGCGQLGIERVVNTYANHIFVKFKLA